MGFSHEASWLQMAYLISGLISQFGSLLNPLNKMGILPLNSFGVRKISPLMIKTSFQGSLPVHVTTYKQGNYGAI